MHGEAAMQVRDISRPISDIEGWLCAGIDIMISSQDALAQHVACQHTSHAATTLTCMTMYSRPFHHFMWPVHISANDTAGLRCAPEMLANV